jgi:hypothetical protein
MLPYVEYEEMDPLTTKDSTLLFLLFKFATQWKILVFLSPFLNQRSLHFRLKLTSSKREILSKSLVMSAFLNFFFLISKKNFIKDEALLRIEEVF